MRKMPLQSKANTVQLFSVTDMEQARKMVISKQKASACASCETLKKENMSLERESIKLQDGIMTQSRQNFRLREGLNFNI
jgi:cell division protein FtsB